MPGTVMASANGGGDQSIKKAPSAKPSRIVRGCQVAVRRASSYCGMERYGTKGAGETVSKPQWRGWGGSLRGTRTLMMGIRETETREVEQNMGFLQFDTIFSKKKKTGSE